MKLRWRECHLSHGHNTWASISGSITSEQIACSIAVTTNTIRAGGIGWTTIKFIETIEIIASCGILSYLSIISRCVVIVFLTHYITCYKTRRIRYGPHCVCCIIAYKIETPWLPPTLKAYYLVIIQQSKFVCCARARAPWYTGNFHE